MQISLAKVQRYPTRWKADNSEIAFNTKNLWQWVKLLHRVPLDMPLLSCYSVTIWLVTLGLSLLTCPSWYLPLDMPLLFLTLHNGPYKTIRYEKLTILVKKLEVKIAFIHLYIFYSIQIKFSKIHKFGEEFDKKDSQIPWTYRKIHTFQISSI